MLAERARARPGAGRRREPSGLGHPLRSPRPCRRTCARRSCARLAPGFRSPAGRTGSQGRAVLLTRPVSPIAPAWRPGGGHVLAYVDRPGHVDDADTDRRIWRSPHRSRRSSSNGPPMGGSSSWATATRHGIAPPLRRWRLAAAVRRGGRPARSRLVTRRALAPGQLAGCRPVAVPSCAPCPQSPRGSGHRARVRSRRRWPSAGPDPRLVLPASRLTVLRRSLGLATGERVRSSLVPAHLPIDPQLHRSWCEALTWQ